MKIITLSVLIMATSVMSDDLDLSRKPCLLESANSVLEIKAKACNLEAFRDAMETEMAKVTAQKGDDACLGFEDEFRLITKLSSVETEQFEFWDSCFEATLDETKMASYMSFHDVFAKAGFTDVSEDEEFFNGGTLLNTEYDGALGATTLKTAAKFVDEIYSSVMSGPLVFPGTEEMYVESLMGCDANAVTCCYVADRQSDGSGSCSGNNCENADPIDNTDVCYIDNTMSPMSGHVEGGFSIFPGDSEGPVYCEGFAWKADFHMDPSYRYRGNVLYEVALKDSLLKKGYVREVPGAPMCGCVNKMPVVSDAACKEVVADEEFQFSLKSGSIPTVTHKLHKLSFQSCGTGSLSKQMAKYASDKEVFPETKSLFDSFVTGGSCETATSTFLASKGLIG